MELDIFLFVIGAAVFSIANRIVYRITKMPEKKLRNILVKILGGILIIWVVNCFPVIYEAATVFVFFSILTVVALLDWDTMRIDNRCYIALLLLLGVSLFTMSEVSVMSRLIGALCISVPMLLLSLIVRGAFGGGDIKLMAVCGGFLGWEISIVSMITAILTGGIYGGVKLLVKRMEKTIAFAPFLCVGMAAGLLYGKEFIRWFGI